MGRQGSIVRRAVFVCVTAVAGLLAAGASCGGGTAAPEPQPSGGDAAPAAHPGPPILTLDHTGWRNKHCGTCHDLPVEGHTQVTPPDCAACHGGNGACDANGPYVERPHAASDDCNHCHFRRHGFTTNADCTACHFAEAGLDPTCGAPGASDGFLRPTSELVSGCFDWPAVEFTVAHNANVSPSLAAGGAGVDFTLRDPAGRAFALAQLLAERPVLLVLGSFT